MGAHADPALARMRVPVHWPGYARASARLGAAKNARDQEASRADTPKIANALTTWNALIKGMPVELPTSISAT